MVLISLDKIIWLSSDPFVVHNILAREWERFLGEIIYSFLYIIYAVVLIVWYQIYDDLSLAIKGERKFLSKFFKFVVKISSILILFAQAIVSFLKGLRISEDQRQLVLGIYGFMYINFMFFIVSFLVYGTLVYRCIKKQEALHKDEQKREY
jgi:hypothetical protein